MAVDVSIVIPLFNRLDLVHHTLNSLRFSEHPNICIEVIVIDDGSSDGSPDAVERDFPWVTLVRNTKNRGASICRNQGLGLAKGEFVLFLDSDDLIEKGFFRAKVDYLRQSRVVSGVYGPWEYFESADAFSPQFVRPRHSDYPLYGEGDNEAIMHHLLGGWYIPINAVLWRRAALQRVGGFKENLLINQDVDLLFRMLLEFRIAGQKSPKALIRIHEGERVGNPSSEPKYLQILELRKRFIHLLEANSLWNSDTKAGLAKFCLTTWAAIRTKYPQTGIRFLELYRCIGVRTIPSGGLLFKLIARLFGGVFAIKVKHFVKWQ